jgi:hypothetical protein
MIVKIIKLFVAYTLLVFAMPSLPADYLYRYTDDEGGIVIDYSIPPEYVAGGYEVLYSDGTVSRVVKRALTDAEKANRSSEEYHRREIVH